jgi:hypothetical protein
VSKPIRASDESADAAIHANVDKQRREDEDRINQLIQSAAKDGGGRRHQVTALCQPHLYLKNIYEYL